MPGSTNIENEVKQKVKDVFVNYAITIGRDVSNVTEDTKLQFPAGLKFSSTEMEALTVPLNEIVGGYGAQHYVMAEVKALKTIKAAQTSVWDRVKDKV